MTFPASIFFDFNLPNSTTWFYFSALLAVALFYKFSRVFSMRNWDVVLLFLLVPGLLLLQEARTRHVEHSREQAMQIAASLAQAGGHSVTAPKATLTSMPQLLQPDPNGTAERLRWLGYLWLLVGSGFFFLRCLLDLTLVQRPALTPNLSLGGLAWLGGTMFICLCAVAFRPADRPSPGQPLSRSEADAGQSTAPVGAETKTLDLPLTELENQGAFWVKRSFSIVCHLLVVVGMVLVGYLHFHSVTSGMAAATFYLMAPYTGLYIGQTQHVWPAALLVWAVVFYRWPTFSGLVMGIAAGTAYFPVVAFPLWLSFYWRRGGGRFTAMFFLAAAVCIGVPGFFLWLNGELPSLVSEALATPAWQPWRVPVTEGFWTGVHWAYRIPIFLLFLTFVGVTACWPAPKNLAHVLALTAAVLIGIQFWYADQGGVYVLWYLPYFLLFMFRPNLSNHRPHTVAPNSDWLYRFGRLLKRWIHWCFHLPKQRVRV